MKKYPLFSLVIPTYNRGYVLWKTIQSVQSQTYPFWELLVIDDGSTDDTAKVVAQFQKDPRIVYYKVKNGGANKARNYGLLKARGEYIGYVDSDDTLYNNFLSVNLEYFTKHKDAVFTIPDYNRRIERYDSKHKLIAFTQSSATEKQDMVLSDIYLRNVKGSGTGTVHKRSVKDKGIRWDESLPLFEDWDFKMQMGRLFPNGFLHIPYVLFEYHQQYGGDGVCANTSYGEWAQAFEQIYQKHKDDPLLKGQTWYPKKVGEYQALQKAFEQGNAPHPKERYFLDEK